MRVGFTYVALLVWILSPMAIPADAGEPSASRWGITTKKNLEDSQKTAPDETESAPSSKAQDQEAHLSTGKPATLPSDNTTTIMAPASDAPANTGDDMKINPAKSQLPEKTASTRKKPSTTASKKGITPQAINWSNDKQKKRCNGYLNDLRSLFLKTRHYSIQGASCDTAVNATAFLKSMETCKQNCPEGLLEHSGYTERIIRNIRYLEKLGNDRCSGSLTPVPQVTQKP